MKSDNYHKKFKEQLILYSYNELDKQEKYEIEKHLLECQSCKTELEELMKIHSLVKLSYDSKLDEDTILESRQDLFSSIRNMKRAKRWYNYITDILFPINPAGLKLAYATAMAVILFVPVYFVFINKSVSTGRMELNDKIISRGEPQISDLRIENNDNKNGEIEISYTQVTPVKVKGDINDIKIQQFLAHSLLSSENPGMRLRTVDAIVSDKKTQTSKILKDALIQAMQYDKNPGVRKEAMNALCSIPFDDEIRDALIYVLKNDQNSGLRIMAINCLGEKNDIKKLSEPNTINTLKEKMLQDENSYIKLKAKTILTKIEA